MKEEVWRIPRGSAVVNVSKGCGEIDPLFIYYSLSCHGCEALISPSSHAICEGRRILQ